MLRFARVAAFAFAAAALTLTAVAEDKKPDEKKGKGEVLKKVIDATYEFDKDKKKLTVTATGQVPSGGWTGAKLTLRDLKEAPKDGIYEYDLTAVPPTGVATDALAKVKASHTWENPPADIKGVKVHGVGDGAKTVKFDR